LIFLTNKKEREVGFLFLRNFHTSRFVFTGILLASSEKKEREDVMLLLRVFQEERGMKVNKLHVYRSMSCRNKIPATTLLLRQERGQLLQLLLIVFLLVGFVLLRPGIGQGREAEVAAGVNPLFEENCMVCHGQGGKGDGIMVTFNLLTV